jgi:hypothetical protein
VRISLLCFGAMMALFVVGSALCASPDTVVKPDPQAVAVATKWLSVFDAGNYAQAYAMLPARIRSSGGDTLEKMWVTYWRAKRTPLGRTLSRKFAKAYFARTLQGSPDGYYEFLYYNTSFQHKAQAAEGVTLTKESGHWQVSGYKFR